MSDAFEGVYAALVTPMTSEQEVDLDRLAEFVEFLIEEGGVHGLAPLGSTGEYYALSEQERDAVARVTIQATRSRVPVFVGTNAGSTRDVVKYSKRAEILGASGVLLAAPYYSLPTPDELFEHFREVNDAIGIPIMLYNYPGRTGVDMTPELIQRLAELERVRYVKESTGDATRVTEIIRRCGNKIRVFCGCDTLALESFFSGAVGWVGGVVNVLPKEHVRLFELAFQEANVLAARELYYRILPILSLMEGGGRYTQFVKAGCELTSRPVGPPRQPLCVASPGEVTELEESLRTLQRIDVSKDKQRINVDLQGRHIEAEDNGRQVKIDAWNDGSIDVGVTETRGGNEVTKRYAAKSEAELKKKHPAAHKLYEKYNVPVPAIQIQVIPGIAPAPKKR